MCLDADVADPADTATACPGTTSTFVPFRPIQYLGNKLRALPDILDAAAGLIGQDGSVGDLFTGTTVVAQGFAARGYRVSAVDTQRYATVFAQALLGIGRRPGESCSYATLRDLCALRPDASLRRPWQPFADREREAIASNDAVRLRSIYSELPLIWREAAHPGRRHVESADARSALREIPLLTAIYAGSYFGIEQALGLDEIRQHIEIARTAHRIGGWQYHAALTAIMSAASAAAHSAGKHFAQPLNAGRIKNERFSSGRMLQDRRIDIEREFQSACDAINLRASPCDKGHVAWQGSAETFVANNEFADLYYVDPPYTAQQYSRFYHVLETICAYEYPQLFTNGEITTGLYPAVRYKSAFSSKRRAPSAFRDIIGHARANGAALVISYSQSAGNSQGNARMIDLPGLLAICGDEFGAANVASLQMHHRYRQFNSSTASNIDRDDPEILITCRPR